MMTPDLGSYIKSEEAAFDSDEIRVGDNWTWNFRKHVQLIFHLRHGQFFSGENNYMRAFKAVMGPILELAEWTEDIEVKDIVFYIEQQNGRALSFLLKRYHEDVFVKQHNIDEMIDQIAESDLAYGGVLAQRTASPKPEIFDLMTIAFCDQTDIMGGPIGFKYHFSPSKLRKMKAKGWGDIKNGATMSIDELIMLADQEKAPDGMHHTKTNKVPGKTIEVYIVRGDLPEHYLLDNNNMENYYAQVHIGAFYYDTKGRRQFVSLYRKPESESNIFFFTSQPVANRALGYGIGERLIQPQVWSNFLEIHRMNMLEAGSKTILQTDDAAYSNRNRIKDMENLEITTLEDGKRIDIVPTINPNTIKLYEGSIDRWYQVAQTEGSAHDPLMGVEPVSGTTFRGQERVVQQGKGPHDRRKGKRAKFIEQLYRDIIIPGMMKEITDGTEFLATLSAEEMTWVTDQLAENHANKKQIEELFSGHIPGDKDVYKQKFLDDFNKRGQKHILKVLKSEFKNVNVKIGINVANKQKDLFGLTDKVLSIFQYVFANPMGFQQVMQIPGMAKMFGDILEYSGISQADFQSFMVTNPKKLMSPEDQMMQAQAMQAQQPQIPQIMQPQAPQMTA